MELLQTFLTVSLGAILVDNIVFTKYLGVCPSIGNSRTPKSSSAMGVIVLTIMTLSSFFNALLYKFVLSLYNLQYLKIIVFILVIACISHILDSLLKYLKPSFYTQIAINYKMIVTNCAILGVCFINVNNDSGVVNSLIYGFSAGVGFLLAVLILSSVRERLSFSDVPKSFDGFPISLITLALISLAFMGFTGLSFN